MKEKLPLNLQSPVFDAFCKSVDKQYIYICDVKTNIWRWSPAAVDYFGLPSNIIYDFPKIWLNKVHSEDRERIVKLFSDLFLSGSIEHSCEYRVAKADGDYIWILCRGCMVYDDDHNMDICAGIITDLGQSNKFDGNTGLLSIHEFQRHLKNVISQSDSNGGILLIGIDHFRRLNESNNYSFGNEILRQYAKNLMELAPKKSLLFRMDGDEFTFIVQDASESEMENLFVQSLAVAKEGVMVDGRKIPFTVSAGATMYRCNENNADELYTHLESALEFSKKNKRGGMIFFTEQLQKEIMERFIFQQKLKESIENDFQGFYLCYQPTVTPDEHHDLIGAEALLRWFHPDFGFVSPMAFIPLLEESGGIIAVGKWVFSTALHQFKQWMEYKPDIKLSVNVSLIQFMDKTFREYVLNEIEVCGYPKEQLILELTESCNIINFEEVQEELGLFRQNGIQIALDDFGTGYASLSVLRNITADWIKVDHSFVAQVAHNNFDQALTESLINLCKRLDLRVCVEGIETKEIENIIQGYKPTMMQGYLFSKPLETKQFEEQYIIVEK